jgi:hypothetical protein
LQCTTSMAQDSKTTTARHRHFSHPHSWLQDHGVAHLASAEQRTSIVRHTICPDYCRILPEARAILRHFTIFGRHYYCVVAAFSPTCGADVDKTAVGLRHIAPRGRRSSANATVHVSRCCSPPPPRRCDGITLPRRMYPGLPRTPLKTDGKSPRVNQSVSQISAEHAVERGLAIIGRCLSHARDDIDCVRPSIEDTTVSRSGSGTVNVVRRERW